MKNKILIIDYKVGNVNSVIKAVKHLGYFPVFSNKVKDISDSDAIILPGQGSFDYAMKKINDFGLKEKIFEHVNKGKKLLGICLGMQILASYGYENNKKTRGLNLIKGEVVKFKSKNIKLPHIGWSEVTQSKKDKIFLEIKNKSDFYHCHSYIFNVSDKKNIFATSKYNEKFTTIIKKKNVYGVQFHPEKSLKLGLKLIDNFLKN